MIIQRLPNFATLRMESIGPIHPSRYAAECWYPHAISQLIFNNNWRNQGFLIPSLAPNSYLGTIIHQLLEDRVHGLIHDNSEYIERWKTLVQETNSRIIATYPSVRNFDITDFRKMYESMMSVMKVSPLTSEQESQGKGASQFSLTTEVSVEYKGMFRGKIDRVKYNETGIELIDYKTGKIYDEDGNLKQEYVFQLNIYALCFEYTFTKKVTKLTLLQTDDMTEFDVPILPSISLDVDNRVKQISDLIISSFANNDVSPLQKESEKCAYCECRHICSKYLHSDNKSPYDVDGIVVDNSSPSMLTLKTISGDIVNVSKLLELEIDGWEDLIGRHLIFINVSNPIGNTYKRTDRTLIYDISDCGF